MHAPVVTEEVGVKHILTCDGAAVSTAVLLTTDECTLAFEKLDFKIQETTTGN